MTTISDSCITKLKRKKKTQKKTETTEWRIKLWLGKKRKSWSNTIRGRFFCHWTLCTGMNRMWTKPRACVFSPSEKRCPSIKDVPWNLLKSVHARYGLPPHVQNLLFFFFGFLMYFCVPCCLKAPWLISLQGMLIYSLRKKKKSKAQKKRGGQMVRNSGGKRCMVSPAESRNSTWSETSAPRNGRGSYKSGRIMSFKKRALLILPGLHGDKQSAAVWQLWIQLWSVIPCMSLATPAVHCDAWWIGSSTCFCQIIKKKSLN